MTPLGPAYNERSWAIDLIGHLKQLAQERDRPIKDAGGEQTLPIRLTPMTATCWVPPLSRVKLGIGWSRGVARDAEQ